MHLVPLQKNISTATNNSTFSNSPKGGVSLPAVPIYQQKPIQKMELEEEQPMQAKLTTQLKADITAAPPPLENSDNNNDGTAQLKELEEEMPLQGKFVVQKKELEDELPMQGKFIAQRMELEEKQPVQGKFIIQKKEIEEQVPIQSKFKIPSSTPIDPKPFQRFVLPKSTEPEAAQTTIQRFVLPTQPIQKKANNTGLPDNLKAGVENLSGFSMDDVKVHYNSAKPAQLQAHAYAQGTDIHIGPAQEKHLPHEAWHVVQQKQGRVQATLQMKGGVGINDDKGLENEADVMGSKATKQCFNLDIKGCTIQRLYDPNTDQYVGKRPKAPSLFYNNHPAGIDTQKAHKYPWSNMKVTLNNALLQNDAQTFKNLDTFANVANPILTNKFYTDLPLLARPRPASFGVEINNLAVGVCWAGWNIRRTPLPQIRVDDPGNNLDLAFDNAQVHTPRSAFAQSIANNLGIEYLHNIIPTLNLAHNTATAYNQQEWVPSAVSPNKLKNMNNPNNTLI